MIFIRMFRSHWSMNVVVEAYRVICTYPCQTHLESQSSFQMYGVRCGLQYMGICIIEIRNDLEIRNAPPHRGCSSIVTKWTWLPKEHVCLSEPTWSLVKTHVGGRAYYRKVGKLRGVGAWLG